jgi:hypothetical protein
MAGTKNNQCTCCLYGAVQSGFEGGLSITRGILGTTNRYINSYIIYLPSQYKWNLRFSLPRPIK